MEYEGERWVQRLRDGVVPSRTALLVTAAPCSPPGSCSSRSNWRGQETSRRSPTPAAVWTRGRRQDHGIWVALRDGRHVVLTPRSALGSPVSASTYRRDVVMRILRSLHGTQTTSGSGTADVS